MSKAAPMTAAQARQMYPMFSGLCSRTYRCKSCKEYTANDTRRCARCIANTPEVIKKHDPVPVQKPRSRSYISRRSRRAYLPR